MVKPQWRDRLREELRKRGLPRAYAARLIEELSDHVTDLEQENRSMDAQIPAEQKLGTPESLAAVAAAELTGRTFAGRHPYLVFAIAPLPAALAAIVALCLVFAACEWLTPSEGAPSPTIFQWLNLHAFLYIFRLSPLALAWLFLRWGHTAGRPAWGLAACGILACFAFEFRAIIEHSLVLRIGLAFEGGLGQWQNGLFQALATVGLGLWTWWRMTDRMQNSTWGSDTRQIGELTQE